MRLFQCPGGKEGASAAAPPPTPLRLRDLIAQAHNGSGKTTCFVLAMLSRVDPGLRLPQALCMCPTRELVVQNLQVRGAACASSVRSTRALRACRCCPEDSASRGAFIRPCRPLGTRSAGASEDGQVHGHHRHQHCQRRWPPPRCHSRPGGVHKRDGDVTCGACRRAFRPTHASRLQPMTPRVVPCWRPLHPPP